jgi:hypothetical protein
MGCTFALLDLWHRCDVVLGVLDGGLVVSWLVYVPRKLKVGTMGTYISRGAVDGSLALNGTVLCVSTVARHVDVCVGGWW